MIGRPFGRGDFATLTVDGRAIRCMVTLASADGESLIVMFDGLVDGCAGMMAILWRDGRYENLITGRPIELARASG